MKIAVTSQNKKTITGHAGKCRRFLVFDIIDNKIEDKELIELAMEQSFHESSPHEAHPLDEVEVVISAGMGQGLINRLSNKGIKGIITQEVDPQQAVLLYLAGDLASEPAHMHHHGGDNHNTVRLN